MTDRARFEAIIDAASQETIAKKVKRAPESIEIVAKKQEKKAVTKKKRKSETESKPKRALKKSRVLTKEKKIVASRVVKSLNEHVHELALFSRKKHCEVDATDHIFRGKEKVITLLREAHKEINHISIGSMDQLFQDKVKEVKARIDQKRIAVMKKIDLACRTDGKVDTDSTTNCLKHTLLLLRKDTPLLEQSMSQLFSSNPKNRQDIDGDQSQEISLTSRDMSSNEGYKLSSRITQDEGDELEIYEQCKN